MHMLNERGYYEANLGGLRHQVDIWVQRRLDARGTLRKR